MVAEVHWGDPGTDSCCLGALLSRLGVPSGPGVGGDCAHLSTPGTHDLIVIRLPTAFYNIGVLAQTYSLNDTQLNIHEKTPQIKELLFSND